MKNKILQLFLLVIFLSAIFTACNTKSSSNSEEISEMDIKNDELNSNVLSSDISTNEGETYVLHTTEEGVIIKQLNRFGEIFTDEYELRAEELGMKNIFE